MKWLDEWLNKPATELDNDKAAEQFQKPMTNSALVSHSAFGFYMGFLTAIIICAFVVVPMVSKSYDATRCEIFEPDNGDYIEMDGDYCVYNIDDTLIYRKVIYNTNINKYVLVSDAD